MPERFLAFEHRSRPLASARRFRRRLLRNGAAALGLVAVSLAIGMVGYRAIEGYAWVDAFLSASMILSGMGPVGEVRSTAGKLFAGCYALYSGLVLVLSASLVLAPLVHRLLHRLHVEDGG
jgi:hypothetical protein